jgi:hypothetical protein
MGTSLRFLAFSERLTANYQLRAATETPIASDICRVAERILQRLRLLEHDPEKWVPVFRKDHAQTTS